MADHSGEQDVRVARRPRRAILAFIAACFLMALITTILCWPGGSRLSVRGSIPLTAAGVEVAHAKLTQVKPACGYAAGACGASSATVLDGAKAGQRAEIDLPPAAVATGLRPGDRVLVYRQSQLSGAAADEFIFYKADRGPALLWLVIAFVLVVIIVARRRGLLALASLGFAGLVTVGFLLPALLSGQPAIPVVLASCTLILTAILYTTHGISMRTSVALAGALLGVLLSAAFAELAIVGSRLAGLTEDSTAALTVSAPWVSLQQLAVAAVIFAGLGALNDVTITQVSAIWELRAASKTMTRAQLFVSALRIGRDHIASTIYTLVFAYLGTALVLLVAIQLYAGTPLDFLTADDIAEEIVRALVGGIALMLVMPVTTAIGALVVEPPRRPRVGGKPRRSKR